MLLMNYGEVSYRQYEFYNNENKGLFKGSLNPNFKAHIEEVLRVEENNPMKDIVKLSNCSVKRCLVTELIGGTLTQQVKVTNPSALSNWRGWTYNLIPRIRITEEVGRQKRAFNLFKPGTPFKDMERNIPSFLRNSIKVELITWDDYDNYDALYSYKVTLNHLEGKEEFEVQLDANAGEILDEHGFVLATSNRMPLYRSGHYGPLIISWEEIDIDKTGGLGYNLGVSDDGKLYNVWWNKLAEKTLEEKDGKYYTKKYEPLEAQLVTDVFPKFLGRDMASPFKNNDSSVEDMLIKRDGYWMFKDPATRSVLTATNYQGFWIKYGQRHFGYCNVNTPLASEYIVVNSNGEKLGTLKEYYNQLRKKF